MNFDFTADFFTLDNLQPLTLRIAGQSDVVIPQAIDEPVEWKDPDKAGGNVLEGDTLWIWPSLATPGVPLGPPLGSLLIDTDGTAWTILAVTQKKAPLNVWEVRCRNLSVVYGLNNVAAVLQASYTKSPGGEALPTWSQIFSGIPARFQPVEQVARILEDAEWPKTTYHVFLGTDIFAPEIPVEPASADYRLVDSAGRHYRIMQYQRAARIDTLPLAVCVLIIEGREGGAVDRLSSSSSTSGS
jgi:hypothetical protein